MQLSAIHTTTFVRNWFLYEQRFSHRLFQKIFAVLCVRAFKQVYLLQRVRGLLSKKLQFFINNLTNLYTP